ncbi:hypothetical protein I2W78_23425 [Streptomyces spinoverrucosus]|uniref:hypothetical protein n=1 Tax=Streptomyces spinoverrucosus TaxID=284043 RepID=UPI0018C3A850|nr:hypothetical protein [Streptomyces spinoverrucosus]MBG0854714.1 hypothetical protein [Streptomyces spinoverrucosus]
MAGKITLRIILGVVVIGAVSANAGDGSGGDSSGDKGGSSASAERTSAGERGSGAAKAAEEKAAFAGDGDFQVGTDVKPGTYRTTGNTDGICYWERAKDAEHSVDSIIASNRVNGTAVVTISASDAYFKTSGCQDWERTG